MAQVSVSETRHWLHNQLNGAIALTILAVFFVALRTIGVGLVSWKKRQQRAPFGWDDGLILASLVAFPAFCACAIVEAQAYLAYYSTTRPEDLRKNYITIYKASYGFSVIYPIACALPKLSICYMYLGLFKVKTPVRKVTYVFITFTVFNAIAWFIPSVVVCHPISAYWSLKPHLHNCIDYNVFGTSMSLPHIVTDLIIMVLPLPLLWHMHMRRAQKIGLAITFLTGSVGIVGGCLRLAFYIHRTYVAHLRTNETPKQIAANVIVSYVEPGMYLIAACLPRLRSLISRLHAMLSTSLYPILARSRGSKEISPSEGRSRAPKVDMKLTGQGRLESLAGEEEVITGDQEDVAHEDE